MIVLTLKSKKYGAMACLYDDADHELISKYKWRVQKGRNTFYAVTYIRDGVRKYRSSYGMHQLLVSVEKGKCRDHKNRNGLDNRRENLRISTIQENNRNATIQRNNTTGYRGVDYNKNHKLFRARVNINRKSVYCRYFKTKEEAALAYNEAAKIHFGEYANLNVVPCASA